MKYGEDKDAAAGKTLIKLLKCNTAIGISPLVFVCCNNLVCVVCIVPTAGRPKPGPLSSAAPLCVAGSEIVTFCQ